MPARNEPPQPDIQSLLSQMQSAINTQIQKVQMSLDSLSGWVDRLEDYTSSTAEKLRLCQASLPSSSSSTDSEESSKQRKRHIAPDISVNVCVCHPSHTCTSFTPFQNTIQAIHNNLVEEKQLKTSDRKYYLYTMYMYMCTVEPQ